jgi:8-oxo-dGTP diphosphatase
VTEPRRQRVAAYAEIRDEKGRVLLVKSTDEIGGQWFLPGGGIGFGESPLDALHREVFEETGLAIRDAELRTIVSDVVEWRREQVHSIRLIYRAHAIGPAQVLRHEVDGSTVLAEWVHPDDLADRRLAQYAATYLRSFS